MALYNVTRTDSVAPGEFVSAIVLARGAAIARGLVQGKPGVTPKNVTAEPMETAKVDQILSVYEDETPTLPEDDV